MNSPFTREQQAFARSVDQIARALNAPNDIDWEQRRYEIARDLFCKKEISAKSAVICADKLIEELKKSKA